MLQAVILGQVAREFLPITLENEAARLTRGSFGDATYSDGRDVTEIGSNTRSVDNIVEGKLVNKRAGLQEEGQRLYRTTMKVRFDCYISQRRGMRNQTCPIPPEAPRTAITGSATRAISSSRGGECLPALTMMDDVIRV